MGYLSFLFRNVLCMGLHITTEGPIARLVFFYNVNAVWPMIRLFSTHCLHAASVSFGLFIRSLESDELSVQL